MPHGDLPFVPQAAEIILMAAPGGLFYASQCHQLYKLSKEAANDVCFRGTGAARSLLAVISHPADVDMGARTLAAAALTHITEDKDICRSVAREDEGIAVLGQVLHRTIDNMVKSPANPEKNVNFLIQVMCPAGEGFGEGCTVLVVQLP